MGPGGEASYGWRHFSELTSVFTGDPAMQVRQGAEDLGSVHPATLSARPSGPRVLLLRGRGFERSGAEPGGSSSLREIPLPVWDLADKSGGGGI